MEGRMRYKIELETMSPLYVGDGGSWTPTEYIMDKDKLILVDIDRLFEDKRFQVDRYLEFARGKRRFNWRDFQPELAKEHPKHIYDLFSPTSREPDMVETFIKTRGRPYLPGSSFKGAIRTALLVIIVYQLSKVDKEFIRKYIKEGLYKEQKLYRKLKAFEEKVFGEDAQDDILKGIEVADFKSWEPGENQIGAIKTIKKGKRGIEEKRWTNYVEVLPPGRKLEGEVTIDKYRIENCLNKLKYGDIAEKVIDNFEGVIKVAGKYLINKEEKFFKDVSSSAREFYKSLKGEGEAFIQLGKYTGWTSKTIGEPMKDIDKDLMSEVIGKVYKSNVDIFPMTRRVVIKNGDYLPMGWVRVKCNKIRYDS